jgi:hypothetical protein
MMIELRRHTFVMYSIDRLICVNCDLTIERYTEGEYSDEYCKGPDDQSKEEYLRARHGIMEVWRQH